MAERQFIATVIVKKVGKKGGECPLGGECTAPTGRHHSMLVWGRTMENARAMLVRAGYYVARLEEAEIFTLDGT